MFAGVLAFNLIFNNSIIRINFQVCISMNTNVNITSRRDINLGIKVSVVCTTAYLGWCCCNSCFSYFLIIMLYSSVLYQFNSNV